MAVHDTQDDDIVVLRSIDDKVGPDNSDADVWPKRGRGLPERGCAASLSKAERNCSV